MSLDDNKAVARAFFEEFSKGNLQAVADLMAEDHVFHFPLRPAPGQAGPCGGAGQYQENLSRLPV